MGEPIPSPYARFWNFFLTVGRTFWMSGRTIERLLPTQDTQHRKTRKIIRNLSGFQTHVPSIKSAKPLDPDLAATVIGTV